MIDYCSCGCGHKIGSLDFIRLHVESEQEQTQREAVEQHEAEQQVTKEYYEGQENKHSWGCFCTRCDE